MGKDRSSGPIHSPLQQRKERGTPGFWELGATERTKWVSERGLPMLPLDHERMHRTAVDEISFYCVKTQ